MKRMAACIGLLLSLSAATAWPSEDDAALTPRMKQTRSIIFSMMNVRGVTALELSPDGKHLAAIAWGGQHYMAMLIDPDTGASRVLVAPEYMPRMNALLEPIRVHWLSNDELAVDFNDGVCSLVGLDGKAKRRLGGTFLQMVPPQTPGEPSQWAIIGDQNGILFGTVIHRVNFVTDERVDVPIGLTGTLERVLFDHKGRLRAATTLETKWFSKGAKVANWYRRDDHSPWQKVAEAPVTEPLWIPIGVPDDSDTLVVLSVEGRETWAMFPFDVATRKLGPMSFGHETEDLIATTQDANQNTIRAMTHGLKPATYLFDAEGNRLQRAVDAALPGAVNILASRHGDRMVILSYSDREPGRWMVLDTVKMTLREVARVRVAIDAAAMRPMQTLTYTAADGLKIPAYLTLPVGPARPRPMVVYIHGGPVARDEWGWNEDVQMLAAAGYAVFQPQFRGSSGFGRTFEQAGYRQWGLAMQDDVTAGVKAMIAQGVADPDRICIYGASYGGYAALWGLVKTPELYRCGISLAGVSDIGERFTDWSDTNSHEAGRELMRFAVGDIETMAAQFDAVSPEKHAAQIRVPVLLGHGDDDKRVPIGHSKRMAAALTDAHRAVETHWYADEGHGFVRGGDIFDFDTAVLDFLDRNIGPPPDAQSGTSKPATAAR